MAVINVNVHHSVKVAPSEPGCYLSGDNVVSANGDYTIHAQTGDTIHFTLSSPDPQVSFDDPPLIWSADEAAKGMIAIRTSATEFYVIDGGAGNGLYAFKLDIDTITLTGRVHCLDDPSILNDNP